MDLIEERLRESGTPLEYEAADTIAMQAAQIERLREALEHIQVEAERENGRWQHLKRSIGVWATAALKELSDG